MVLLKCQTLQLSIKGVETFHRGSKYGNFWSPVFLIRRKTASKTQRHFMAIILKNSGFGGKGAFRAPNAQRFRTSKLGRKIENRKHWRHWSETEEIPKETVEILREARGNTMENGWKRLGKPGNISLRESTW